MYRVIAIFAVIAVALIIGINVLYQRDADLALENARPPAPAEPGSESGAGTRAASDELAAEVRKELVRGFKVAAQRINERAPIDMPDARLDRASVGPGATLTYHYTVPEDSRFADPGNARDKLASIVSSMACSNKQMKPSLQYGATYVYIYSAANGDRIASFEVDRHRCGYEKKTP